MCVLRGHSQLSPTGHSLIPGWVPCPCAEHLVEGPRKASCKGVRRLEGHRLPLAPHASAHPGFWETVCSRKEDPPSLFPQENMNVREHLNPLKGPVNIEMYTNIYVLLQQILTHCPLSDRCPPRNRIYFCRAKRSPRCKYRSSKDDPGRGGVMFHSVFTQGLPKEVT